MKHLILCVGLIACAGEAQAVDCQKIIKIHAFLSRAQFQCGFNGYADEMLQQAKVCSQSVSEKRLDDSLKSGLKLFDQREKERGHDKMCEDVLETFPQILSR